MKGEKKKEIQSKTRRRRSSGEWREMFKQQIHHSP
jgi:hypothetical protein